MIHIFDNIISKNILRNIRKQNISLAMLEKNNEVHDRL